jgi:recombination protein U
MMNKCEVVQMTIRYPNGKKYVPVRTTNPQKVSNHSFSNRGKTLEEDLNDSNEYYLTHNIAVIHQKPVPIQVVNVNYPSRSAAVITEAYFRIPSTTDYNGVWNGHYIDFEAKETKSKTSFPLQNIHEHQMSHMKSVTKQKGIAFVIVKFSTLNRHFVVPYDMIENKWERMKAGGRKSIALSEFESESIEIELGFMPSIDYLSAITDIVNYECNIER